jgi:hypothetical protein
MRMPDDGVNGHRCLQEEHRALLPAPDRTAGVETAKALGRGARRLVAGPYDPVGSVLCLDVFGIMVYDCLAW